MCAIVLFSALPWRTLTYKIDTYVHAHMHSYIHACVPSDFCWFFCEISLRGDLLCFHNSVAKIELLLNKILTEKFNFLFAYIFPLFMHICMYIYKQLLNFSLKQLIQSYLNKIWSVKKLTMHFIIVWRKIAFGENGVYFLYAYYFFPIIMIFSKQVHMLLHLLLRYFA